MMLNQLLQVYVGITAEEIPHGISFLQPRALEPQCRSSDVNNDRTVIEQVLCDTCKILPLNVYTAPLQGNFSKALLM